MTPVYDFCYLDGAHDFTIDGMAVYLVEKLLRPAGLAAARRSQLVLLG